MSDQYDFVIVGAGILGTAIAAVAADNGFQALVLRMTDSVRPSADTLRNQGWLQSGLLYKFSDFESEEAYRDLATKTYFAGADLMDWCGLPISKERGIVGTSSENQRAGLLQKANLLRLTQDEFGASNPTKFPTLSAPSLRVTVFIIRFPTSHSTRPAYSGSFASGPLRAAQPS